MANVAGSFSGTAMSQTVVSAQDVPNHELGLVCISGVQKSTDADWNNAHLTYWGTADLQSGNGVQRGCYNNVHTNGDRDWGTFEGKVTTTGSGVVLEGTFRFAGGTGKFEGISGKGTYRGRMTSPTQIEMEWSGEYQVAGAKARGAA